MGSLLDTLSSLVAPIASSAGARAAVTPNGTAHVLLTATVRVAQAYGLPTVGPADLVHTLCAVPEVRDALAQRGVSLPDLDALFLQLDGETVPAPEGVRPVLGPEIEPILAAATEAGRWRFGRVVSGLAAALPPVLSFLRRPLAEAAADLHDALGGAISTRPDATLTLEGWNPKVAACVGVAQKAADKAGHWWLSAPLLLVAAEVVYRDLFASRGFVGGGLVDAVDEAYATRPPHPLPLRNRPDGDLAAVGINAYASLVRAERYAAEDRTDVTLGHLLASLRAHDELRPIIDRLV